MIGLPPSLRGQTAYTNPHAAWISWHVRILPNFIPWLPPASVSHILAVGLALGFFTCICTFIQGPHKILVLKTIRFPLKKMTSHSSLRLGEWQTCSWLDQTHEEWLILPSWKFAGSMNLSHALTACLFSPGPHRLPFERKLITPPSKLGSMWSFFFCPCLPLFFHTFQRSSLWFPVLWQSRCLWISPFLAIWTLFIPCSTWR